MNRNLSGNADKNALLEHLVSCYEELMLFQYLTANLKPKILG
jgi:hypothetical protein